MSEWVMRLHQFLKPLIALMMLRLLESDVIHSDDTSIDVQIPGGGIKRCYLWDYVGDEKAPYTIYDFRESRSRDGPNEVLKDFSGFLQADAYTGYDDLYKLKDENGQPRIVEVACWAHARRYFIRAEEAKDKRATEAIKLIAKLFGIEKQAREECKNKPLSELYAHRLELRREKSVPILEELFKWMDDRLEVLPESPLGKALTYAQNNREALMRYANDGRFEIDNNAAERAIRPVAIGRKNWLFAGSNQGGHAAATFFTLIESAKRNGLNPFEYLHDLFVRMPSHSIQKLDDFLPDKWQPPEQ
jgi:hypothetical protein